MTVSVAAEVVTEPTEFANTASTWSPFWLKVVANESVVEVAPAIWVQLLPLFVETCHCTVGVGLPVAAALNVAIAPVSTDTEVGSVVMTGAETAGGAATWGMTLRSAAGVRALPTVLVKIARYRLPLSLVTARIVRVGRVAPAMLRQVLPPFVESCQRTLGVGVPLAAVLKRTRAPDCTVWLCGATVTLGARNSARNSGFVLLAISGTE